MVYVVNKLDFSDKKYQSNGTVGYENYKGKFFFLMKDFVSFGTYRQSMFFISTIFFKYKFYIVHVPLFQLAYISNTTHPSHKQFVNLCRGVHYMCWGNQ